METWIPFCRLWRGQIFIMSFEGFKLDLGKCEVAPIQPNRTDVALMVTVNDNHRNTRELAMCRGIQKTGPNQHYIPQMLLRGLGVLRKKKTNQNFYQVRVCYKENAFISATDRVGTKKYFYSPKGDSAKLDSLITVYEAERLNKLLQFFYECQHNNDIDSEVAAEFVGHLSLRTAYVRNGLALGVKKMVSDLKTGITATNLLFNRLGVSNGMPSEVFSDCISEFINENYPFKYSIPCEVIINACFFLMRENLEALTLQTTPFLNDFFHKLAENIDEKIEIGHRKGMLAAHFHKSNPNDLRQFIWKVIEAPSEGAILPDCVAIAISKDGRSSPYIFANVELCQFIVVPINKNKLLIGSHGEDTFLFDYNLLAAKASDSFFVCDLEFNNVQRLQNVISESSNETVLMLVDTAINSALGANAKEISFQNESKSVCNLLLKFLHDFDREEAQIISKNIAKIFTQIGVFIKTNCVESIIFTDTNFADALASISNYTFDTQHMYEKDLNLKKQKLTWQIIQHESGMMSCCLVGNYELAHELSCECESNRDSVYRFAYTVACLSMINNDYSPLKEYSGSNVPFGDCLYTVFESYAAARIAGSIVCIEKESHFDVTVVRLHQLINLLRTETLELVKHNNFSVFLKNTSDAMIFFLRNAAAFLGHAHAGNNEDAKKIKLLLTEMKAVGLGKWFFCFEDDLIRVFKNLVDTGQMIGLEVISMHFQRLLASEGLFLTKHGDEYACCLLPKDAFDFHNQ